MAAPSALASVGPSPAGPAAGFACIDRSAHGEATRWLLRRNCSLTPGQAMAALAPLVAVTLAVAFFFLARGAPLVLPFAGLELLGLVVAMRFYARHATDREQLELCAGRLGVECRLGDRCSRVEFAAASVRVLAGRDERALIELNGHGRRVSVGRFVRPERRRALADELRAALAPFAAVAPA